MKRREFITLVGGAAAAWPLATRAQQPAVPVVGFLRSTTRADSAPLTAAFVQGLKEAGFVEGQSVSIEYRYADNEPARLPALIADLIGRQVAVIAGDTIAMLPAKAATATVPIVFATGGDPVKQGFVASFNRPGGNVTGVNFFLTLLGAKRLELLRQLVPKAKTIGMLVNPSSPNNLLERDDIQAAVQSFGLQLLVRETDNTRGIETAFETFVQRKADALFTGSGAFMNSHRETLAALAARHALPAIYAQREIPLAGGLMSYGPSVTDAYRQVGAYSGRILKGEKPSDLPVMQSTKFEFVINLKTAKAIGLEVPDRLLALADEVIE